jgi:hypothetical protein
MREPFLVRIVGRTSNLVLVDIQSSDVSTRELDNLSSWTTHAASDVEDFHTRLDSDVVGEVMFVSCNGSMECLAVGKAAEVEALAPSVLVQVCG